MNSKNTFINLVLAMLVIGTPAAYYFVFRATNSYADAILAILLYVITVATSSLVAELWRVVKEGLSLQFSKWFQEQLLFSYSRFRLDYIDHVIATNRYLDTRRIFGQDIPHYLELSDIVVPLTLHSFYPGNGVDAGLFNLIKTDKNGFGTSIVILGKPGSGKTTMIQQVALALAINQKKIFKAKDLPNKIPIVLKIEEYSEKIQDSGEIGISALVCNDYSSRAGITIPLSWLESQLKRGKCVVLIDGLDQVANATIRGKVADWVQSQIRRYSNSHFIITSRPNGYLSNPLNGVLVLEVKDFTPNQVENFINNWYYANEIWMSKPTEEKRAIRTRAHEGAAKLVTRLRENDDLQGLATNPLLLTMIAIVFSAFENLPGRRVELYEKMTEISLEQRWRKIVELDDPLSRLQKEHVLRLLAYQMMERHVLRISERELFELIEAPLAAVSELITKETFLKLSTDVYGLLIEAESHEYEFAHKTFQEYLASTYIKLEGEPAKLYSRLEDDWWEETIRLYSAQTNATPIIEKCLAQAQISVQIFRLVIHILAEALEINPQLRADVENMIRRLAFNETAEYRGLSALAKLSARLRFIKRNEVSRHTYIDTSLITNQEYELFLSDMRRTKGEMYYPDHWTKLSSDGQQAFEPATGVRPSDLLEFFRWVAKFDTGPTKYRPPFKEEAEMVMLNEESAFTYFLGAENSTLVYFSPQKQFHLYKSREETLKLMEDDIKDVKRLISAIELRSRKVPTSKEILDRATPVLQGGGNWFSRKDAIGIVGLFGAELDEIRENKALLEDYEVLGKLLDLNVVNDLGILYNILYSDKKGFTRKHDWLKDEIRYSQIPFDISEECKRTTSFISSKEIQAALDSESRFLCSELLIALRHIRTRDWLKLYSDTNSDIRKPYGFLRWFVRISTYSLLQKSQEKQSKFESFAVQESLIREMRELLFGFFTLEDRIRGSEIPKEGIRLIKEEKRI